MSMGGGAPPPQFGANGTTPPPMNNPQYAAAQNLLGRVSGNPGQDAVNQGAQSYVNAAQAQSGSSAQNTQAQTQANRPDQNTPFGFSSWHQNPDGSWSQSTGFSGPLSGATTGLEQQLAQQYGQAFDNGSAAREQAINAAYGQATSRLNPMFDQRQEQLQSQLAQQGLDPNSAAYRNAMAEFDRSRNDAYQGAMNSAIGQGTAAQQATFGENLAARQLPFQELAGMQGLLNMPTFMGAGRADPTQYLTALMGYQNNQLAQNQQSNELLGSGLGALGGAAGAGLAFLSDERLKQDIQRLPVDAIPGVPLAAFSYKSAPGHRYLGVIAQDLERVAPQHVGETPEGVKVVSSQFAPFSFK